MEYLLWRIANNSPDNPFFLKDTTSRLSTKNLDSKSRNLCSVVLIDKVECFFLKQPTKSTLENKSTVENENIFYDWIKDKGFKNVPKIVDFDSYNTILTTSIIADSINLAKALKELRTITLNSDKWNKSEIIIKNVAERLAAFHQISTTIPPPIIPFSKATPSFLPILDNLEENDFSPLSIINLDFLDIDIKLFQRIFTDYSKNIILQTNQQWESQTVIHFDFRTDNILINNNDEITITDWEMCSMGDPLWDVTTILNSLPFAITNAPTLNNGLRFHEQVKNLIKVFWETYTTAVKNKSITVEKLKVFWKCMHLKHYLELDKNFDAVIDELTEKLN
jgi:thiamine kinase-like enzyme